MTSAERKSLEPFLKDSVEFYQHQVDGIRKLARMRSFLLGDEMGLGKSLQALTVFCIDVKLGASETLLIVCPASLRQNWAREIAKFTRIPFTLLGEEDNPRKPGETRTLTPAKRDQQLQQWFYGVGPRILISNYEQIASVVHKETLDKNHFDVIIFDEAHRIKSHKAKRTKACLELKSNRSFLLTGTPLMNRVDELWPILNRINPAKWPKYWAFVNRYCVFGGYENRQITGVKNEQELNKQLADVMVRRLKRDVLKTREPIYIKVFVGLSKEQKELYKIAENAILEAPDEDLGEAMNIKSELTKFMRLKQICDSPAVVDPSFADSSEKLDRVVEIVEELYESGRKVIIFTQFRAVIQLLTRRLIEAKVKPVYQLHGDVDKSERQNVIDKWAAEPFGSPMLMMTQIAEGLNMTAARDGIFVDKLFTPGRNAQAVDRMDRIGRDEDSDVTIYEMIAVDTVEERVEEILETKTDLFDKTVSKAMSMNRLVTALKDKMREKMRSGV